MSRSFENQFDAANSAESKLGKGDQLILHHEGNKHYAEVHFTKGEWVLLKSVWEQRDYLPLQDIIIGALLDQVPKAKNTLYMERG